MSCFRAFCQWGQGSPGRQGILGVICSDEGSGSGPEWLLRVRILGRDLTYILIQAWFHVVSPKDTGDGHEKTLLGERLAGAHAAAPAKGIVALFVGVWSFETVEEAFGSESVWFGELSRVAVDGPHVARDGCVFRDQVASVFIVLVDTGGS